MKRTKAVALYARVSTADQSATSQLHALRAYSEGRDESVVEFVDEGVSGAKASRPGLDEMMAAARRRELSAIVVTKLDRIGRSALHLANLAAELESLDVDLVVTTMSLDTSTPAGKLLFTMLGGIAEFERELIKERVAGGVAAAKARGVRFGRKPLLDAAAITRAQRMRAAGRTWRHVARVLGVSHSTVMSALRA